MGKHIFPPMMVCMPDKTFPTDAELTTWQAGFDGPLFSLPGTDGATLAQEGDDAVRVTRALGARIRSGSRPHPLDYSHTGGSTAWPGFSPRGQ